MRKAIKCRAEPNEVVLFVGLYADPPFFFEEGDSGRAGTPPGKCAGCTAVQPVLRCPLRNGLCVWSRSSHVAGNELVAESHLYNMPMLTGIYPSKRKGKRLTAYFESPKKTIHFGSDVATTFIDGADF